MSDNNVNRSPEESPLIEELRWGFMKIKGYSSGKDFKLFPGGAEEWDWNKTNTHHVPGIQPEDVKYLLEKGARWIVLSQGMENRLETAEETKNLLHDRNMKLGVDYFIDTSPQARERYNQFVKEGKPVGALIHSTC